MVEFDRWIAFDADTPIAMVETYRRPDRRRFLTFTRADPTLLQRLIDAVAGEFGVRLHASVDEADAPMLDALGDAGFEIEMEWDTFRVPFDRTIDW